jgi:hypothetical protein
LGSLARAVQKRANQAPPDEGPYWFYVDRPTPILALDEYREIGEFVPGSWYLAKGSYGDWIHAANETSTVEGWIAGWAVIRAPS